MKAIALITVEGGQCILHAISAPNEITKKEILKRGLKDVVEVTAGGRFISTWDMTKIKLLFSVHINTFLKSNRDSYAWTDWRTWRHNKWNINQIAIGNAGRLSWKGRVHIDCVWENRQVVM